MKAVQQMKTMYHQLHEYMPSSVTGLDTIKAQLNIDKINKIKYNKETDYVGNDLMCMLGETSCCYKHYL